MASKVTEDRKEKGGAQRPEPTRIEISTDSKQLYSCTSLSRSCPWPVTRSTNLPSALGPCRACSRTRLASRLALLERSLRFPAPPRPVLTNSPGCTTCAGTPSGGGAGLLVTFASPPRPVEWTGAGECSKRSRSSSSSSLLKSPPTPVMFPAPPRPVECSPRPRDCERSARLGSRDRERELSGVRRMLPAPPRPVDYIMWWSAHFIFTCGKFGLWNTHHCVYVLVVILN